MLGAVKSDAQDVEFDDVNRGDRPVQRIHILTRQNLPWNLL